MNENHQVIALIELVEKFIPIAKSLLEKGVINEEVYIKMTENKIKFLETYKVNPIK